MHAANRSLCLLSFQCPARAVSFLTKLAWVRRSGASGRRRRATPRQAMHSRLTRGNHRRRSALRRMRCFLMLFCCQLSSWKKANSMESSGSTCCTTTIRLPFSTTGRLQRHPRRWRSRAITWTDHIHPSVVPDRAIRGVLLLDFYVFIGANIMRFYTIVVFPQKNRSKIHPLPDKPSAETAPSEASLGRRTETILTRPRKCIKSPPRRPSPNPWQ